jgi:hypothetical protein
LAPGGITLVIAVVAGEVNPASVARWHGFEPRGGYIVFGGIVVFASTISVKLGPEFRRLVFSSCS